eukprot:XP_014631516.1 TNF receptor-associated factor homolog 1b [Glycine max]
MVMNDHYKGNSFLNYKVQKSPNRGKNQVKASCNVGSWTTEMDSQPSGSAADVVDVNESGSSKLGGSEPEGAVLCLQDRLKWLNQQVIRKFAAQVQNSWRRDSSDHSYSPAPSSRET